MRCLRGFKIKTGGTLATAARLITMKVVLETDLATTGLAVAHVMRD